jgi:hypothetical protein
MLFVEDATYVPNGIGDSHLLIRSHFILYFASSCEANPQPIAAERHSDAANNPQHPSNRYNPIAKKTASFCLNIQSKLYGSHLIRAQRRIGTD